MLGSGCHLEAVVEEEQGDIFTPVTWLVSQGDGFNPVYQTTMGGQQISLQRQTGRGQGREKGREYMWSVCVGDNYTQMYRSTYDLYIHYTCIYILTRLENNINKLKIGGLISEALD